MGRWLLAPVRGFVVFWTAPVRAEPMAAFRILLGVVGLSCLLVTLAPSLDLYLGPDGLCPADSLDEWLDDKGKLCVLRGPVGLPKVVQEWLPAQLTNPWKAWAATPAGEHLLFWGWVGSFALVAVGFLTRFASIAAWILTISFEHRLPWLINGGDQLLGVALFYLMLMPAGAAWSIDSWLRKRIWPRPGPVRVPPWSLRLAQIQICLVYLFTGLAKAQAGWDADVLANEGVLAAARQHDWFNGEAVYWVLNDTALNRVPYPWLPVPMFICRLLSWGTLVFEIGFPFFVIWKRTRPLILLGGVGFHLGIWAATEVGWFSFVTLCWYPLFLSLGRDPHVGEPPGLSRRV